MTTKARRYREDHGKGEGNRRPSKDTLGDRRSQHCARFVMIPVVAFERQTVVKRIIDKPWRFLYNEAVTSRRR
jgi:hypothetical protein